MTPFRLALVNPNTNEEETAAMAAVVAASLPEAELSAITVPRGPRWIETAADVAVAAGELVAAVAAHPGHDAYLVACFSDPGLLAARELTTAPVVGVGEASLLAASVVARRFAVLTTLRRGVPDIEDQLRAAGLRERCVGVLPLGMGVDALASASAEALAEHVRAAVAEHGAEAVVLACGSLAAVREELQDQAGVPVVDGLVAGAHLAHGLWRAGLRTSTAGSLAPPEAVPYRGMDALHGSIPC